MFKKENLTIGQTSNTSRFGRYKVPKRKQAHLNQKKFMLPVPEDKIRRKKSLSYNGKKDMLKSGEKKTIEVRRPVIYEDMDSALGKVRGKPLERSNSTNKLKPLITKPNVPGQKIHRVSSSSSSDDDVNDESSSISMDPKDDSMIDGEGENEDSSDELEISAVNRNELGKESNNLKNKGSINDSKL